MFYRKKEKSGKSVERREWTPEEIKEKQDEFARWYAKRLRFSRRVFKINEIIWAVLWSAISIRFLYLKDPLPVFLSGPAAVGFWYLLIKPTRFAKWVKRKAGELAEKLGRLLEWIGQL